MVPVFRAITDSPRLNHTLVVTGMHLLPDFRSVLAQIHRDHLGRLVHLHVPFSGDSGASMAMAFGRFTIRLTALFRKRRPDIVLLQGDRGEMLAGAIVAAHMNIPIVHMSGGDFSGSIDDSIRNTISKFAHIHLTTCARSTQRLIAMGESPGRIIEVGEPVLDVIRAMPFLAPEVLAEEFRLDLNAPLILATQHPVTSEVDQADKQMGITLRALETLGMQTILTYPNTDAGNRQMRCVIDRYRRRPFLRVVPALGLQKYLSVMRIASVMLGNSSSGLLEAPSFRLPTVNIGTRQHGRLRAANVIDVGYNERKIVDGVRYALRDRNFRRRLATCQNPYGDGRTAPRTARLLERLRLSNSLITKWMANTHEQFV
jgi:UDP-N-acetylglucosamine 2-epimerase (non-hydrolysing)/GDP/UDP-N,N'-diacetylbacillosamine 2-epimerase (hydrolysing)